MLAEGPLCVSGLLSRAGPTLTDPEVFLFTSSCGTLPLMAVVTQKESAVTFSRLPSPIFWDRIWLYSLFRGEQENLLQHSRVVLQGLVHCPEILCCGPPPLQDSLGLGDTAGALALLVPSSLPPLGTLAGTHTHTLPPD